MIHIMFILNVIGWVFMSVGAITSARRQTHSGWPEWFFYSGLLMTLSTGFMMYVLSLKGG